MTQLALRTSLLAVFVEAIVHSHIVDVVIACAQGVAVLFLGTDTVEDDAGVVV